MNIVAIYPFTIVVLYVEQAFKVLFRRPMNEYSIVSKSFINSTNNIAGRINRTICAYGS